ncbi:hypothetical protein Gotri_022226 [Gossypium trilobum]|uniref:Protein kinase domain-containing protein n=1 Tax=Gossypium trilobum TaxID=34281 RepID=A0A7J9DEX1_9ROSI|nr:hypothetical protein [Gossypium trilobum]
MGEERVRLYTQQILQGLSYLHVNGVAHCDIKSQNILIGKEGAKIADLGCAKLMGKDGENQGFDTSAISGEVPEIPSWFSEKGKDFLGKCLKRDLKERWTAKELLQHPFLEESDTLLKEVKESTMDSPNTVLDQGFWDSFNVVESPKNLIPKEISMNSPTDRIKKLLQSILSPPSSNASNWTFSEDWMTVRSDNITEDDFSSPTVSFMESFEEQLETETPILDEDFFSANSAENTIYFSSILAFNSVTDDYFVSDNLNFETVNEISCSIIPMIQPHLFHIRIKSPL